MLLQDVLNEFYEDREYQGFTAKTLSYYRVNFTHFIKDTQALALEDFNEKVIRGWLLAHKHLSPVSVQTYYRCLKVLANWLYRRGYVSENPMTNLPKPKAKQRDITVFNAADIRKMLAEAKRLRSPLRDIALITLLLDTGVRIGEACSLTLQSVNWTDTYVTVDGKTGIRHVPFGRKTKAALKAYIDGERRASSRDTYAVFLTRDGNPLISESATQRLLDLATNASVSATKRGPHTFRHTFSIEYIRAGGDAFTLQRLLGHQTLDMTRRYVNLAQTDLREAHRKFSPANRML